MDDPDRKAVVDKFITLARLFPDNAYRKGSYMHGPGKLLSKLTPEEHAAAMTLTEKDFQHRIK